MKKSVNGFTIVELLIVIVVIAILATITIVAYNGIQSRSKDSSVQADLHSAMTRFQEYQAANGSYPASVANLTAANVKLTRVAYDTTVNNGYYCRDNLSDNYSFTARSPSGSMYTVSSASPTVKSYSGGWAGATICVASGFSDYVVIGAYVSSVWQTWVQ